MKLECPPSHVVGKDDEKSLTRLRHLITDSLAPRKLSKAI